MGYTYNLPTRRDPFGVDIIEWERSEEIYYTEKKEEYEDIDSYRKTICQEGGRWYEGDTL